MHQHIVYLRQAVRFAIDALAANNGNRLAEKIMTFLFMSAPPHAREPGSCRTVELTVGKFLLSFWPTDNEGIPMFSHLHHSVIVEQSLAMIASTCRLQANGRNWFPALVDLDNCDWNDHDSTISFEVTMPIVEQDSCND